VKSAETAAALAELTSATTLLAGIASMVKDSLLCVLT